MSNIVIFRSTDGKTGYRQAESVEEAARFVERLRNGEGVDEAHIYKLEEVVFEYKPYFRVEVGSAGPAPEAPAAPAVEAAPRTGDEAKAEPVAASVGAPAEQPALDAIPVPTPVPVEAGKRGLFSR